MNDLDETSFSNSLPQFMGTVLVIGVEHIAMGSKGRLGKYVGAKNNIFVIFKRRLSNDHCILNSSQFKQISVCQAERIFSVNVGIASIFFLRMVGLIASILM